MNITQIPIKSHTLARMNREKIKYKCEMYRQVCLGTYDVTDILGVLR